MVSKETRIEIRKMPTSKVLAAFLAKMNGSGGSVVFNRETGEFECWRETDRESKPPPMIAKMPSKRVLERFLNHEGVVFNRETGTFEEF